MITLPELWLPILLSAVLVFIASSIANTLLPHHRSDFRRLPDEEGAMAALRRPDLVPGEYAFPYARGMEEMKSEGYAKRREQGPVAFMTVLPSGPVSMGPQLAGWFVFTVAVSIIAAYMAGRVLPPTADYLDVFRVTGTTAFAGYVLALWQQTIWFGRPWTTSLKFSLDGTVYALLTAGVFGWLWPQ
jgi:hypothetical protein